MLVRFTNLGFLPLGLIQILALSPHKIFNEVEEASNTLIYTHRLQINRPVHIPCFKPEDAPTNQTSTIFWSHRGFKIDKDSPFISARWDNLGTLMIYHVLPRKLYLWCHFRTNSNSHIFIHHLEFVASPFIQVVYAVEINATLTSENEKILDGFYFTQMGNCIIHSESGGTVLTDDIPGVDLGKSVVQKTAILEATRATCESRLDCIGVSLDFFECFIHTGRYQSVYSIDFSTIHSAEMGIFLEVNATEIDGQINQVWFISFETYEEF